MVDLSNVSTQDLLAYKSGDLSKVSTEGLMALHGVVAPPEKQGFFSRLGTDYSQRVANAQDLANQGVSGKQTMLETIPEMGAQLVAGPINDVVKEGMASLAPYAQKVAADIPGAQAYSNAWNKGVQPAVDAAGAKVAELYGKLPQRVQNAGNAIGTTAQAVGTVVPAMKLASHIGPTVGEAASSVQDALTPSPPPTHSKILFSEGDKAYADANASGAGGSKSAVNDFLSQAHKTASQDPLLMEIHGPDAAQGYLNNLMNLQGNELPLKTAQALDIDLREKAAQAFRTGDNSLGARYGAIRQALRDNIYNNPDPTKITGGLHGFHALQEGNRLYAQGYALEDIENAIENGMKADVPSTGIKNAFKTLSRKIAKNGPGGLSAETVAAIDHASKTGMLTGLLKNMGSKLIGPGVSGAIGGTMGLATAGPFGAAAGGALGSAAGYAAGAPFRAGATALQLNRANDVLRSIVTNPKYIPLGR